MAKPQTSNPSPPPLASSDVNRRAMSDVTTQEREFRLARSACNPSLSYKALVFMAMLSLQFGIQPIVTQKFMSKKIIMSTVIFMQEVVKLIIGVVGISLGKTRWADVASGEFVRIDLRFYICMCLCLQFLTLY